MEFGSVCEVHGVCSVPISALHSRNLSVNLYGQVQDCESVQCGGTFHVDPRYTTGKHCIVRWHDLFLAGLVDVSWLSLEKGMSKIWVFPSGLCLQGGPDHQGKQLSCSQLTIFPIFFEEANHLAR